MQKLRDLRVQVPIIDRLVWEISELCVVRRPIRGIPTIMVTCEYTPWWTVVQYMHAV